MDRVRAMFTILKSFGCVSSQHSDASSRFAMVFSLDFNHAGQAAAGHLQVQCMHMHMLTHTPLNASNVYFIEISIFSSAFSSALPLFTLWVQQTMMLDKWRVCQTTPGESNFLVFSQMLAGIGTELRYTPLV